VGVLHMHMCTLHLAQNLFIYYNMHVHRACVQGSVNKNACFVNVFRVARHS